MRIASFDNSILFVLPCLQASECYSRLVRSFNSRGWLVKELRKEDMDDFVEFLDDIRYVDLENLVAGPSIDDMVTFLSDCPELAKKEDAL